MKNRTETRPAELNMNLKPMLDVIEFAQKHTWGNHDLSDAVDVLLTFEKFYPVFYGAQTHYDYETEQMTATAVVYGSTTELLSGGAKIMNVHVIPIYCSAEMPMTEAPEWLLKHLPENPSMHGAYYHNGKEVK